MIFISNTIFIPTTPRPRISWQASNTSTCSLQSQFVPWGFLVNSFNEMHPFLGRFPELQKATVSLVMFDYMEQLGSHWTDFHEI